MIFENAYITNAGHALLTRATAGTKIIWGKCGCYSQNLNSMSQSAINALTSLTGPVALGTASAAFEIETGENGTAKITCQVDNTCEEVSPGYAQSFGLWAKIEGDENEVLVVVARVGSHQATYFPAFTDATDRLIGIVDLSVTVQSGVASTINITPSGYALASNLQAEIDLREALEERVVTTHSADDESSGDEQSIRGKKYFTDGIGTPMIEGGFEVNVLEGQSGNHITAINIKDSSPVTAWESGINMDADVINIGGSNTGVVNISKAKITGGQIDLVDEISPEHEGNIRCDHLTVIDGVEVKDRIGIYTDLDDDPVAFIDSSGIQVSAIHPGNNPLNITGGVTVSESIKRTGSGTVDIGASDNAFNALHVDEVYCNNIKTYTETGGDCTLDGIIPSPTVSEGEVEIPVGAIVCLYVNGFDKDVGEEITFTGQSDVELAGLNGSASTKYATPGTYRLLSKASGNSAAIAIRIG